MSDITAADLARLRAAHGKLAAQTRRDLSKAWAAMDLANPQQARDDLLQVVDALGSRADTDARILAMEWYEDIREKVGGLPRYTARVGGSPNHDQMIATTRWAAGGLWGDNPGQVKQLMEQAIDRWQWAAANDTIVFNATNDKSCRRWARVPSGAKTCAFCTMLASRGWVYATARSAGDDAGHQFHTGCDCLVVPNFESTIRSAYLEGYDPHRYLQLYKRGIEQADDGSREAIVAGMRRADPDQYTDGVWPKLPSALKETGGLNLRNWEKYRRDLAFRLPPNADTTRFKIPPKNPAIPDNWDDPNGIQLRVKEWNHILYGDVSRGGKQELRDHHRVQNSSRSSTAGTGYDSKPDMMYRGGHMWGHNWMSGGDAFPQDWGPREIQQAIADVIKDGQYTYEKPGRAFYTGNKDGITIRVNVNPDGKLVLSAYPVGS